MEDNIYKLIKNKAQREISEMTEAKANTYVRMCYAGLRAEVDNAKIIDIAKELDYTASGVSKLVSKWLIIRSGGDVTSNLIAAAYIKQIKGGGNANKKTDVPSIATYVKEDVEQAITSTATKRRTKGYKFKLFNLKLTENDIKRERACIRESIKFMEKYGKGNQPRMHGEYYIPGTSPSDMDKDKGEWLSEGSAAMYCGCLVDVLNKAANQELVERRVHLKGKRKNYYEYKISSLDDFIKKFGLK